MERAAGRGETYQIAAAADSLRVRPMEMQVLSLDEVVPISHRHIDMNMRSEPATGAIAQMCVDYNFNHNHN